MKAAIYCRLSKEDEYKIGESESIQNQKSMLLQYALENGFEIYQIYSDEDYSGIDRNRPAFNSMLQAASEHQFDVVLAKTQSRFTRDMELVEKYLHGKFVEWGIRFIAVVDHVDTNDTANKKSRQINGLINEWYLEDLSTNVRSVLDHKRKEGLFIGSFARYGYCKDPNAKGKLIIDPEAADVVRRIFSMALNGIGAHKIARILNDEKIPSPTAYKQLHGIHYRSALKNTNAALWSSPTVYQILHDPLYIGNTGMHGKYASNKAVSECDVLFSIGTRFNDRITGDLNEFAPKAKIVHIDVDTASISRNVVVDVPIVSDAKLALEKLLEWAEPKDTAAWQERIKAWDEKNPLEMRRDRGMTPQMIMEHINHTFDEAVFVTDVGQNQMWATQYLDIDEKRQMITSGGLGTMGFGFPAAIGAKIGNRNTEVVCVTGDGGFQMNIQEMATAIVQGTPVIICLLNNQYLGMVRQMQQLFYGKRYSAVCLRKRRSCPANCKGPNEACPPYTPDFVALAESYGAHGIRVEREEDIQAALDKARTYKDAPTVIEFLISSDEIVLPMVKGGNPMSEMILK